MPSEDERLPKSLDSNTYTWEELNEIEEAKKQKRAYPLRNTRRSSLPDVTSKTISELVEQKKLEFSTPREKKQPRSANIDPEQQKQQQQPTINPEQQKMDEDDVVVIPDETTQTDGKKRKREKDPDQSEEEHQLIDNYQYEIRFLEVNINREKVGAHKFDAVRSRLLIWIDRMGKLKGENTTLKEVIATQKNEIENLYKEVINLNKELTKSETIREMTILKINELGNKQKEEQEKLTF